MIQYIHDVFVVVQFQGGENLLPIFTTEGAYISASLWA